MQGSHPVRHLELVPRTASTPTCCRWMSMPESAAFDLVLLHYGNGEPPSCPHCRAVRDRAGNAAVVCGGW